MAYAEDFLTVISYVIFIVCFFFNLKSYPFGYAVFRKKPGNFL